MPDTSTSTSTSTSPAFAYPSVFPESVVTQAPEDPLFGLMAAFKRDSHPKKVDLGIGAYRDDNARPWVLPVVREVGSCRGAAF